LAFPKKQKILNAPQEGSSERNKRKEATQKQQLFSIGFCHKKTDAVQFYV